MKKIYTLLLLVAGLSYAPLHPSPAKPTFNQRMGSYVQSAKKALCTVLGFWATTPQLADAGSESWAQALGGTSWDYRDP